MKIEVHGEDFELLPEKCLFWPRRKLLAIADLHLGKSETFQARGLWLPSQAHRDDLALLTALCRKYEIARVLFLGDLVHSRLGTTAEIRKLFADWCAGTGAEIDVLIGNHDRALEKSWPSEWSGLARHDRLVLDSFVFQHDVLEPNSEPAPAVDGRFHWGGHVHPVVRLSSGADRVRLPCFVVEKGTGLLPAFSSVAGGFELGRKPSRRIYAVAGTRVFEVGANPPNNPPEPEAKEFPA